MVSLLHFSFKATCMGSNSEWENKHGKGLPHCYINNIWFQLRGYNYSVFCFCELLNLTDASKRTCDDILLKMIWSTISAPEKVIQICPPSPGNGMTLLQIRMETDRIRMESDSASTFYYILNQIRIQIRIFSDTNTKRMPRIRIRIRIRILTWYMS